EISQQKNHTTDVYVYSGAWYRGRRWPKKHRKCARFKWSRDNELWSERKNQFGTRLASRNGSCLMHRRESRSTTCRASHKIGRTGRSARSAGVTEGATGICRNSEPERG